MATVPLKLHFKKDNTFKTLPVAPADTVRDVCNALAKKMGLKLSLSQGLALTEEPAGRELSPDECPVSLGSSVKLYVSFSARGRMAVKEGVKRRRGSTAAKGSSSPLVCPKCNSLTIPPAKFCVDCGQTLSHVSPSVAGVVTGSTGGARTGGGYNATQEIPRPKSDYGILPENLLRDDASTGGQKGDKVVYSELSAAEVARLSRAQPAPQAKPDSSDSALSADERLQAEFQAQQMRLRQSQTPATAAAPVASPNPARVTPPRKSTADDLADLDQLVAGIEQDSSSLTSASNRRRPPPIVQKTAKSGSAASAEALAPLSPDDPIPPAIPDDNLEADLLELDAALEKIELGETLDEHAVDDADIPDDAFDFDDILAQMAQF